MNEVIEVGDIVQSRRDGLAGVVTMLHENGDGRPNGIARVYVLDEGAYSWRKAGDVLDMGTIGLVKVAECIVDRRRDGIAYLTLDGRNNHLRCFSRYGATNAECAPVAWRLAFLFARETGEPITTTSIHDAMGLVVNEHDSVSVMVREYGHGMYR